MDRRDFLLASGLAATSEFLSWPPTAALAQEGAEPNASADAKSGPTIERRLADFALAVKYDDLPKEIVATVKRLLLDTLGCGYGAIGSAAARLTQRAGRQDLSRP